MKNENTGLFRRRMAALLLAAFFLLTQAAGNVYAEEASAASQWLSDPLSALSSTESESAQKISLQTEHSFIPVTLYDSGEEDPDSNTALPSSYSSVEKDYVTEVKNQNPYSTCWTFAMINCIESNLIKNHEKVNGKTATNSNLDLSELHLAWFFYHTHTDKLKGTSGDSVDPGYMYGYSYLTAGGNNLLTAVSLANWTSGANESVARYSKVVDNSDYTLKSGLYDDLSVHVQGYRYISTTDAEAMKQAIKTYGALAVSYYHYQNWYGSDAEYYNEENGAYYYDSLFYNTNHAVSIVGWDDEYPKENFNFSHRPEGDGAWLVKNSWGDSWGNDGYFWISYEDVSLNFDGNVAVAVIAEPADNYDYNYQYDGGVSTSQLYDVDSLTAANVFTVSGSSKETLKAVGFGTLTANMSYRIQIYKNPKKGKPASGTKLLSTALKGETEEAGYYTVKLKKGVTLKKGDTFSVVVTLTGKNASIMTDIDMNYGWVSSTVSSRSNQSFLKRSSGYYDLNQIDTTVRIKAYTDKKKPAAPTLKETSSGVKISWKKSSKATGYIVYRKTSGGSWKRLKTIHKASKTSYTDKKAKTGKKYFYRVRTYKKSGGKTTYGSYSKTASITVK